MGGKDQELLLDWLSAVPDRSRASAALFIEGPAGIGKSVLKQGIATLFGGYMDYAAVNKDFNEGLRKSPLLVADEGIKR
jgi:phage/plasmid-associated DNA primase